MHTYIWLFGENEANSSSNNSFFLWKCSLSSTEVKAFFVLQKTAANVRMVRAWLSEMKSRVLWKDSIKHKRVYRSSDLLFVSTSSKDVLPSSVSTRRNRKPFVYLQHGVLGFKRLEYKSTSYANRIIRFCIYNPGVLERFQKYSGFQDYQIYQATIQPRYSELARQFLAAKQERQVLWFLTWREYIDSDQEKRSFLENHVYPVIDHPKLHSELKRLNFRLKLVFHDYFGIEPDILKLESDRVEVTTVSKTDLLNDIAVSKSLITDYSSVCFDFAFLNKNVFCYQPDFDEYSKHREFYFEPFEIDAKHSLIPDVDSFINVFSGRVERIDFFYKPFEKIELEKAANGYYLEQMFEYFLKLQKSTVTFLGYGFYGKGGTVSSVKALAEALLRHGRLVQLVSLTKSVKKANFPPGLPTFALDNRTSYVGKSSKRNLIMKVLNRLTFLRFELRFDINRRFFNSIVGLKLKLFIKKCKSHAIVSTRESVHLMLAGTHTIGKKVYFFHTHPDILKLEWSSQVLDRFKAIQFEKAAFVTDSTRKEYSFLNAKECQTIGNCVRDIDTIPIDALKDRNTLVEKVTFQESKEFAYWQINQLEKSIRELKYKVADAYSRGVYIRDVREEFCNQKISAERSKTTENPILRVAALVRFSSDKLTALKRIIALGKECVVVENKQEIVLQVYGNGALKDWFYSEISKNRLNEVIQVYPSTSTPIDVIRRSHATISLSDFESFGMVTMESIMNGVPSFSFPNSGSIELLGRESWFLVTNVTELRQKLEKLFVVGNDDLVAAYSRIQERYGAAEVVRRFIDLLDS